MKRSFELREISYISEPVEDYVVMLNGAKTMKDLQDGLNGWRSIAGDAADLVDTMCTEDFTAFRKALRSERRGKFCGEAATHFLPIIIPALMFEVTMIAEQFGVPWGCAYIRLRDIGRIVETSGRAVLRQHGERK